MEIARHIINNKNESAGVFFLRKGGDGSYYWEWDYDASVDEAEGKIFEKLYLDVETTIYIVNFEEWHLED